MNITDRAGNSIVNIGRDKNIWDIIIGNNSNENWWLTGWNPKVQGLTNKDLTMRGTLDFGQSKDIDLYDEFKKSYGVEKESEDTKIKSKWYFDDKTKTATFTWRE